MDKKSKRAKEIQNNIREVLMKYWDPIGVKDIPEAQDEYDSYVGGIYRKLVSGVSDEDLIDHLNTVESESMGLSGGSDKKNKQLLNVVKRLKSIDLELK